MFFLFAKNQKKASAWVESFLNEANHDPPPGGEGEEEDGDLSSSVADLTDSRSHTNPPPVKLPHVYTRTLAGKCAKVLGDNLLRFDGFEQAPVEVRGKVFTYLVKSGTLSSRKLSLLVGPDVLHLNFDGAVSQLIHNGYVPSIVVCTNLKKLCIAGCQQLTEPSAWMALAKGVFFFFFALVLLEFRF